MNSKTLAMLVGVLATSALAGCISDEDPASILVTGNVQPISQGSFCAYKSADQFYTEGILDLSIRNDYLFGAQLFNILPTTKSINGEDEKTLRPETNQISLEKAIVRFDPIVAVNKTMPLGGDPLVTTPKKQALVLSWELPVQLTLIPGGANAIMPFTVIPSQVKTAASNGFSQLGADWQHRFRNFGDKYKYRLQGVLHLSFEGVTAGGSTVRSESFSFPLTLCWGCLLKPNFVKTGVTPDEQWKDCSKLVIAGEYKAPCNPGQDDAVHCAQACQICKAAESVTKIPCDDKFCPALD